MSDTSADDFNAPVIKEFRENEGVVGGFFEGMPLLLLHHTGAKSGTERVNPLAYQRVGDSYAIFASKGGATSNPDWYYNLVANPKITYEMGTGTYEGTARVAESEERNRIWEQQKLDRPQFAEYENTANRTIPVVIIDPA